MTTMITIEEAQTKLKALIASISSGDEVEITMNDKVVAKLVAPTPVKARRPEPGLCKDLILEISPDFDEPLEEMKEYMY